MEPQDVESGSLGKFLFVNVEFAIGLDAGRELLRVFTTVGIG